MDNDKQRGLQVKQLQQQLTLLQETVRFSTTSCKALCNVVHEKLVIELLLLEQH